MADNQKLIDVAKTDLLQMDPSYLQRRVIEAMEEGFGVRLVDASNPLMQQLETAVLLSVGTLQGYEAIEQRLYPENAQTYVDIYRHMSDEDYLKVFSTPATAHVDLYLRKDEIIQYAVTVGGSGTRRLTIPRDTLIRADNYDLMIHNPINIDVTQSGGMRIAYDTLNVSTLKPLASNEVKWDVLKDSLYEYVRVRLPVEQLSHVSNVTAVSISTGFSQHFPFVDQYYYCNVYHWINGEWVKMKTTHTDRVYNVNEVTATLRVFQTTIQVVIPTVYFSTNQVGSKVRVDVFSSKGELAININEYEPSMFGAKFVDYTFGVSPHTTAFNNLPTKFFLGATPLKGGSNALSFEELRDAVIMNNTGAATLPITPAQIQRLGEVNGYNIVKNIDVITNREYLATKAIQPDTNKVDGLSPLPVTMSTLISSFETLVSSSDTRVGATGDRLTIFPTALFKTVNGQLIMLSDADKGVLSGMTPDQLITTLNNNSYLYTPFYYVLDIGENRFRSRVYDLDSPEIPLKNFVENNDTTLVEVNAVNYTIERTTDGYRLFLLTESNDLFKSIMDSDPSRFNCQLSYLPSDGGTRVYLTSGVVMDGPVPLTDANGEFFIEFNIETDCDVNENNGLLLENFGATDILTYAAPAALTQLFDLVYIVDDVQQPGQIQTDIDLLIEDSFLDGGAAVHAGITHDQITIKFGEHLNNLWTRTKTSVAPDQYQKYAEDVIAYHESNVYQYDVNGAIEVVYDSVNEIYVQTILHYLNDPVLNNVITSTDTNVFVTNDTALSFSAPTFVAGDVGKYFIIPGGTVLGNGRLSGKIIEVVDSQNIVIDTPITQDTVIGNPFIYGDPVIKHAQGDNILDPLGNPVSVLSDRELNLETDMLMFDGAYYFATSDSTLAYRKETRDNMVHWITQELEDISMQLLENTNLFFYPQKTIGEIEVRTIDGGSAKLEAKQSLSVRVYISTEMYNNDGLVASIETTIGEALNAEIKNKTLDLAKITENAKARVGDNVQSIKIDNFLKDREYIVSIKDDSARFSIGKQAVLLSDGKIAVKDAIVYNYYTHDTA